MSKPLMLSIGDVPDPPQTDTPANAHSDAGVPAGPSPAVASPTGAPSESLAQIYEVLKRHEETLRDLVVEVRLLYHNLPEKEKKRLEAQRERTTREVRDGFAGQLRSLEEMVARLRAVR
jgi:hypothetical protein